MDVVEYFMRVYISMMMLKCNNGGVEIEKCNFNIKI